MSDSAPAGAELPRSLFVAVALASSALLGVLSWRVFLFWDDFVFLGEAREADLTWGYLTDPLFKHFSPVVRLLNIVVVDAIPEHPWVVPVVLIALLVCVVSSVTWLMVVLYGRTWPALVGSVLLAPSLTLLPLGNWWTAGGNILPALRGFYVAFGAMVLILAGRSLWWALPCFAGAAVGVLAYELLDAPLRLPGAVVPALRSPGVVVAVAGRAATDVVGLGRRRRHRDGSGRQLPAELLRRGLPDPTSGTWCTQPPGHWCGPWCRPCSASTTRGLTGSRR